MLHKIDKCIKEVLMVIRESWIVACQDVKDWCTSIDKGLINELEKRFLAQELMKVIGIIYFQYLPQPKVVLTFLHICKILNNIIITPSQFF
jgi:hypothetical protein